MNPVSLLRSPWAATIALCLCMWAQIPHSQTVFEYWADGKSGAAFAWGFEAAVLMFVVRKMHVASWIFAGLSALINVGYYGLQAVDMWAWFNEQNWLNWLLSVVLPFAIAMYSHVLAHVEEEHEEQLPAWAIASLGAVRLYTLRAWGKWRNQPGALPSAVEAQALETQAQVEQASPDDHCLQPSHDVAQPDPSIDATMQVDASDTPLALTELDEMNARIIVSIRNGNYTPYAISKDTGIAQTTLKRKQGDGYGGRLAQLCAMGMIHNSSGADGSEYRLNEET